MSTHECPAPRCKRQVPQHQLACRADWFRLPKDLRDAVWAAYYGGGMGSAEHRDALAAVMKWYRENEPAPSAEPVDTHE